jgi:polyketide cyclase/dehydrase/lipid transport protein
MATFSTKQHYAAPASRVWDLIGDFYSVEAWMPGITVTGIDTDQHTRTLTMEDGGRLVERLLEQGTWFHRYRFDDPGPVPVRDFSARIAVTQGGPDRSTIEWTASFEPAPGVPAEEAAAVLGGFYQACLDRVTGLLGS